MIYYIYRHIRLDKNIPFYIGKGTIHSKYPNSYYRAYSKRDRNIIWNGIIKRTNYKIEIIYKTESEEDVFNKEIYFILLYGRIDLKTGTLCNLIEGGRGYKGISPEISAYYSIIRKGKKAAIGSYKDKCKKIYQYTSLGKYVAEFESRHCAARLHNTRCSDLSKATKGILKIVKGFQWRDYKQDNIESVKYKSGYYPINNEIKNML